MLTLLLALMVCMLLHVATMAVAGHLAGVVVREVSLGFGPALLAIGRITLRPFLIGGFVRFKDSRAEALPPEQLHGAFDHQPLWSQLIVVLSGCLALLAIAIGVLGVRGADAFVSGFKQLVLAAASPLSEAQTLLDAARTLASTEPFLIVLAVVAAKLAAGNLLPFPVMNGGVAIALVGRRTPLAKLWSPAATRVLSVLYLLVCASWLIAIVNFSGTKV